MYFLTSRFLKDHNISLSTEIIVCYRCTPSIVYTHTYVSVAVYAYFGTYVEGISIICTAYRTHTHISRYIENYIKDLRIYV